MDGCQLKVLPMDCVASRWFPAIKMGSDLRSSPNLRLKDVVVMDWQLDLVAFSDRNDSVIARFGCVAE